MKTHLNDHFEDSLVLCLKDHSDKFEDLVDVSI